MTIIKQIEDWFKAAVPNPTDDNRRVQLGCHLEEVSEMTDCLQLTTESVSSFEEVNRSNWSKFVDGKPVFDENGKIKKGDGYTPPDLSKFVGGE